MNQLTVNDFFCGCGGMGIGFQKAGYEIKGAWDFDKYAVESYKANVGEHAQQADIKDMTWQDIPEASVWTFGFPCQDLSVAGKQAGMVLECIKCGHQWKIDPDEHDSDNCPKCGGNKYKSASRSGLFFEIMRLLDETEESSPEQMPKVLIAENVKGLKPFIAVPEATKKGYAVAEVEDSINISHINSKTRRGRIGKQVAQTLLTGCEQVTLCPTTYRVRKLTPTEYGRLQAFPMNEWKQVVSDTQAYKQFGNAVTTTVATAVAEAIKIILAPKELEEITQEFDPIEQLKNILSDKSIDGTEEEKADIIALEMAIELMTTARKISDRTAVAMEKIGG